MSGERREPAWFWTREQRAQFWATAASGRTTAYFTMGQRDWMLIMWDAGWCDWWSRRAPDDQEYEPNQSELLAVVGAIFGYWTPRLTSTC